MPQPARQAPYHSYNPYFLIPFALWIIVGGVALLAFNKQVLFATFNTHHTGFLDEVMLYVTSLGEGVIGTVIMLILLGRSNLRNWWYFTAAVFCNTIPSLVITQMIKHAIHAPRPLKYFDGAAWIHFAEKWPRLMDNSFPSGHTCSAFSLFCFLSFLLPQRHRVLGLVFFIMALMVAYSRMYLAAHFFEDVYAGSIIGVIFVILIISLMRRYARYFFRKQPTEITVDS